MYQKGEEHRLYCFKAKWIHDNEGTNIIMCAWQDTENGKSTWEQL